MSIKSLQKNLVIHIQHFLEIKPAIRRSVIKKTYLTYCDNGSSHSLMTCTIDVKNSLVYTFTYVIACFTELLDVVVYICTHRCNHERCVSVKLSISSIKSSYGWTNTTYVDMFRCLNMGQTKHIYVNNSPYDNCSILK